MLFVGLFENTWENRTTLSEQKLQLDLIWFDLSDDIRVAPWRWSAAITDDFEQIFALSNRDFYQI